MCDQPTAGPAGHPGRGCGDPVKTTGTTDGGWSVGSAAEGLADVEERRGEAQGEQEDEDDGADRHQLAVVDSDVAVGDLGRSPLVDDDDGVAPVEGQDGQQVEEGEDEADPAEEPEQRQGMPVHDVAAL